MSEVRSTEEGHEGAGAAGVVASKHIVGFEGLWLYNSAEVMAFVCEGLFCQSAQWYLSVTGSLFGGTV